VVVAQQLFTTVKRSNAIAIKSRKTAHRITVGRFFSTTPALPTGEGERKRPLPTSPKERRKKWKE